MFKLRIYITDSIYMYIMCSVLCEKGLKGPNTQIQRPLTEIAIWHFDMIGLLLP